MKSFVVLLICLIGYSPAFTQDPQIDSLEQLYSTATADTQRFQILKKLTDAASNSDLRKGLIYAERGIKLAESSGDKTWQPKFYEMTGRNHANLSNLDSALIYFDKAITGYTAIDNKRGEATTSFKIAWVLRHQGKVKEAMEADLKALGLMESINDQIGISNALGRLADDMSMQNQYQEALVYAERAVALCEKYDLKTVMPYALTDAGNACGALSMHDQALAYYDRAIALLKTIDHDEFDIADFTNNHGNALKHLHRFPEAINDYKMTLDLSRKLNYAGGISSALANLGEVNIITGNYKEALPYQLETIALQEENKDVKNLTENYDHITDIYKNLGDYKNAYLYQAKARMLNDSILSEKSDQAVSELRTKYETDKKDTTIALQENSLRHKKTMQWIYMGIAALLGLFAITFYRNAVQRKKSNTLLAIKNAENELLLKEIHHRVKNNLEVVSSLLALQSSQIDDPGIKDAMQEGQNRVQSIGIVHQKLYQGTNLGAVEMKDYFINLSDSILDSFGAEGRVTIECAMNKLELDIDTAVPLGLITNEILTNALKYAFPDGRKGRIEIQLSSKNENSFQLRIADDGIGKSDVVHGTGFGGQLISLLARQINASMREEINEGTIIYFDFAMKKIA